MSKHGRINLLYLDDEEQNLESFRASYRKDYNIFTTSSPEEAEQILNRENIHIVLADQRMPNMTGVEFFEKIRNHHTDPVRILVTGYSDITAAIDAINRGEVFRFIDKPWDHEYVQIAIENAYEIYHTRKELQERNTQLEKACDELDKFVYSASHDLRAPLMSILGIVQLALIDKQQSKENQEEYLRLIELSVKKLDTFILSIIDYYKNSRGDTEVSDIDFAQLVQDVKDSIQFIPGSENIKYEVNVKEEIVFRSDQIKLRIILNNLIGNAVKYHDPAKTDRAIKIDITSDKSGCTIRVEDNGIGIAAEDLENIFKMFYRGTTQNSGSGIGLYVVHEAASKLGGVIDVQSVKGEKSIFTIHFPAAVQ